MKRRYGFFSGIGKAAGTIVLLSVFAASLFGCGKSSESGNEGKSFYSKADTDIFQDDETVLLRLAETMPSDHPSAKAMEHFAGLVEKESGGKIKIKVYYDEELGTPEEIIEQMKFGGIAMARVNSLELSAEVPALSRYLDPRKYSSAEDQMKWMQNAKEELCEICQLEKITPLVWYYPDSRCFYSSNRSIEGKEDLAGTKVRTTDCQVMKDAMGYFGAEAVGITESDLYRSLSSGDVQYAESGFSEFVCRDYGKYIHHATLVDYAYYPDVMLINTESLNTLSPDEKEIIKDCAAATYEYHRNEMESFQKYWKEELKKNDKMDFREEGFE